MGAHALPVELARRVIGVHLDARPRAGTRVVLDHVGPQAVHLHPGTPRDDDRARRRALAHAEGCSGVDGIPLGDGALPVMAFQIEHVHVVEAGDLILVSTAAAEKIGL